MSTGASVRIGDRTGAVLVAALALFVLLPYLLCKLRSSGALQPSWVPDFLWPDALEAGGECSLWPFGGKGGDPVLPAEAPRPNPAVHVPHVPAPAPKPAPAVVTCHSAGTICAGIRLGFWKSLPAPPGQCSYVVCNNGFRYERDGRLTLDQVHAGGRLHGFR